MISGICSVCGKVVSVQTCRLCGRQVCPEHFDASRGMCISCKMGKSLE
ncbi:MAG: hypothetical protein V3V36_02180 [Candidatus Hydrothermarchaeaceae archaeon]